MNKLEKKCIEILVNTAAVNDLLAEYNDHQQLYKETSDLDISISPHNIISMLQAWNDGKVSNEAISEWASFILISGAYDTPELEKDFFHYDPLWSILGEISTPEIDGPLTIERSQKYIKTLSRL